MHNHKLIKVVKNFFFKSEIKIITYSVPVLIIGIFADSTKANNIINSLQNQPNFINLNSKPFNFTDYCLNFSNHTEYDKDIGNKKVIVTGNLFNYNPKNKTYTYSNNVKIAFSKFLIETDHIDGIKNNDQDIKFKINQPFKLSSSSLNLQGGAANFNANQKKAEFNNVTYQLVGSLAHGSSEKILIYGNDITYLNASYSTCGTDTIGWQIKAKEINKQVDSTAVVFRDVKFYLGKVPIIYLPYLKIYAQNEPISGILVPSVKFSNNDGLSFKTPYYYRIKNNLDLTVIPGIFSRGAVSNTFELRYLNKYLGLSSITYEGITKTKQSTNSLINLKLQNDKNYYKFNINHTSINNKNYFRNSNGSAFGSFDLDYIINSYEFSFNHERLRGSIDYYRYIPIGLNKLNTYSALPNLSLSYSEPLRYWKPISSISGQLTNFSNPSGKFTDTLRLNLIPQITYIGINNIFTYQSKIKLYASFYQQKNRYNGELNQNVNRFIPEFSYQISSKLLSDKEIFSSYTGVITPSIGYVYRPNKDRGVIFNNKFTGYDSSYLPIIQFIDNSVSSYAGYDFIGASNLVTAGINYQLLNNRTGENKLNFTVNKHFFISKNGYLDETKNINYLNITQIKINYHFNQNFSTTNIFNLNEHNKLNFSNNVINYATNNNKIIQFSHLFATKEFIKNHNNNYLSDNNLDQIGVAIIWRVNNRWAFKLTKYLDRLSKKNIQSEAKFSYSNCCWSASAGIEKNLINSDGKPIQDNKIIFEFELNGLSNNNFNDGFDQLVKSGKIKYTK